NNLDTFLRTLFLSLIGGCTVLAFLEWYVVRKAADRFEFAFLPGTPGRREGFHALWRLERDYLAARLRRAVTADVLESLAPPGPRFVNPFRVDEDEEGAADPTPPTEVSWILTTQVLEPLGRHLVTHGLVLLVAGGVGGGGLLFALVTRIA